MTTQQIAEVLGVATATVSRDRAVSNDTASDGDERPVERRTVSNDTAEKSKTKVVDVDDGDVETVCPTCHGTGRIPLSGRLK
jgi:hypothetical protein